MVQTFSHAGQMNSLFMMSNVVACAICLLGPDHRAPGHAKALGTALPASSTVRPWACGKCGEYGHNVRTCTQLNGPVPCYSCGSMEVWDEGDTVYCSPCMRRTWVSSGEAAERVCDDCGEIRDAKAYACRHCGG